MRFTITSQQELIEKIDESLPLLIEAFLNTEGGTIYVGISHQGEVVGVDDLDKTLRTISNGISTQIEPEPTSSIRLEVEFHDSKAVIKLTVKKGYYPLYCLRKEGFSSKGCHYREGKSSVAMDQKMVQKRLRIGISPYDLMIAGQSRLQDLTFLAFKALLLEKGYPLEERSFEANFQLRTAGGAYNYLAELLSDENRASFIFAKFKGKTKAMFSERSDYGSECILLGYEAMKQRLKNENICKTITDPRPRRDIYLYDRNAVNEALACAVAYNDYRITEPQIAFFDDRMEIISHGGLTPGLEKKDFFQGVSKIRNEQLMKILARAGLVERENPDVPLIVSKYGVDAFEIDPTLMLITFPFNKETLTNHGPIDVSIRG